MKQSLKFLAAAVALAGSAHAAPFLAGENAEVFFTGTAGLRMDDNIFLGNNAKDDVIYNFDPGVEVIFGNKSTLSGRGRVGGSFNRFTDHDDLDSELFSSSLNVAYDGGKTTGSFSASFAEMNQNTVDVLGFDSLIARNVFNTAGNVEVSVTEKTSVTAGFGYSNTDYRVAGFADQESVNIPLHFYYEVTPKVDLGLGYRYRESWLLFGRDSRDHFVSVSTRGEFSPKLTGTFDVGVTHRDHSPGGTYSMLGIDGSLSYAVTPKSSLQLTASRNFDVNSQAQEQKNTSVGAFLTSNITPEFAVTVGTAFRAINYYMPAVNVPARTDDYYDSFIGASYTVNEYVRVGANFSYRKNDSEVVSSDFRARVLSLSVSLRY
ncbi:MAG: outer membrane beta-barrel protein [Opitutus sp.]|nr:outer membrane beta-barrel protein [Opitutus sp.]